MPGPLTECPDCGAPTGGARRCPSCQSELWTPPDGPLYRVVHRDAREQILTEGFVPAEEGLDGQPAGVYLWATLDAALDYLGDKDAEPHDVYEIQAADDVIPDPLWHGYGAWVSPAAIAPQRVRLIRPAA